MSAPAPKLRSESNLRLLDVLEGGRLQMEFTYRGRIYTTVINPDDSVTMIEAAALAGVTRSTVHNWTKGGGYHAPKKLELEGGRVQLVELRRYVAALGSWWMSDHPPSKRLVGGTER